MNEKYRYHSYLEIIKDQEIKIEKLETILAKLKFNEKNIKNLLDFYNIKYTTQKRESFDYLHINAITIAIPHFSNLIKEN